MTDDTRCCGTGTCLIDANGRCWCGQQWDGEQMCRPVQQPSAAIAVAVDADDEKSNAPDAEGHLT
ncbi:MAG: hypothetical protein CO066_15595 [Comamonadaceae bacterium CG_4_9_14_0_8_um_filter_60_18]|nr:MAG: hypothetical protein COW39_01840 [Comamonadaceae bacterium CG17_big_fil_post_rev_8_21_14_2_50_60_13]PIY23864.1 MAG: hypothetical protein COZ10_08225 [Comamonadaceae bacterium CG_4_10_14_3_um_filter_60_75]PJC11437.1 MAG: hypothetical protein CO066_15595 [Comamonadaceae bacterium CG_4_9_14_0_8_um_filter_60_18]